MKLLKEERDPKQKKLLKNLINKHYDEVAEILGGHLKYLGSNDKSQENRRITMINPLYDNVLVKRKEVEEKSKTGNIILPNVTKKREREGVVIKVGHGRINDGKIVPLEVKEGDRVIFGHNKGIPVIDPISGKEYLMLKEIDILGTIMEE